MPDNDIRTGGTAKPQTNERVDTSSPGGRNTDALLGMVEQLGEEDSEWVAQAVAKLKTRVPPEIQCRDLGVGDTIDERYQLVARLGSGGFGVVFKAHDTGLDRDVALKLLHPTHSGLERYRKRFEQEARSAAAIESDHVVRVYNVGTTQESLVYIVMELVEGQSVSDWLEEDSGRSPNDIARIVLQAAKGLGAAHQHGLIHRDIKCANLLIDRNNRTKVTDFGLARVVDPNAATMSLTEQFAGTLPYMSPEQLAATSKIDQRSDVYSLGVVLYELLGAARPFRGIPAAIVSQIASVDPPPLRQLNPNCPRDLATIAEKCLRKEPGKRYQSAEELAADLQRWMDGESIKARRAGRVERTWRWCNRNRVVAALWVVVLLVAIVSIALAANLYVEKTRLDRALQLAYQLLEGIQSGEYKTVDDTFSGILQGKPRVSPEHHDALVPLFMAILELQAAATQARSPSDDTMLGGAMDIIGQLGALRNAQSAMSYLDQALSRSDKFGLAWLLRAQIRMEFLSHRKEDVMADWQRAVHLLPDCSAAHSGRGWCYWGLQNKDYDRAFADFEKAIEIDSRNEYAHFGLAQILYLRDDDEAAAYHYETAYRLPPRYNISAGWRISRAYEASNAHWHAAVNKYKADDLDGAIDHKLRAIELAQPSKRPELWLNLLTLLEDCEPEQASTLSKQLEHLVPVAGDSDAFRQSKAVLGLAALIQAGTLGVDDLDEAVMGTSESLDVGTEFNSDFIDVFETWLESDALPDETKEMLRRMSGALR